MKASRPTAPLRFDDVRSIGLTLRGVTAAVKYDGTPVLQVGGCFMAGLAGHSSAEPESLVVRCEIDEREWLLADAPETYYVTEYYQPYPVVLARLARLDREALRDLLMVSHRLTIAKVRPRTSL
jgi:hypothetical protein